jgi:hypothetical protein
MRSEINKIPHNYCDACLKINCICREIKICHYCDAKYRYAALQPNICALCIPKIRKLTMRKLSGPN